MKTMLCLTLAVLCLAVASAAPSSGACSINSAGAIKDAVKSCSACQWQCLTDAKCEGLSFDGTAYTKEELTLLADCGDGYFTNPELSPGLCVLFDVNDSFIADVFDTQEQDCDACLHQCETDSRCTSFLFNGASGCGAPPPPPPPTSPVPPPPSPIVVPPTGGIVVRPGICNYDILRYEAPILSSFIATLDSDDCCASCSNTTGCTVASFCFDSEGFGGCGASAEYPRYTCQLMGATLGDNGFPTETLPATAPAAKGWISVTVTPENTPGLFP